MRKEVMHRPNLWRATCPQYFKARYNVKEETVRVKIVLRLLLAVILILPVLPLTAVGQKEGAEERQIVIYNSYNGDPEPRRVDQELVAMFMAKNPDINVVHSIIAHEDFKQAIRAYLTASTPPDVMTWFAGNRARFFIDKGLILDISDVWEQQGWNKSYPKGFRAMSSVGGKQYFVPTSYYWWAVYYRKSIFQKSGFQVPETSDQFMQICEKLKQSGVAPITIGTKYRWTAAAWFDYLNMRVNGPEYHINLMLGTERYDDPRVKRVFTQFWAPMIQKGYFIKNPAAYTWQEAIPFMSDGKAAMYLMGDFIRDSYPKEQVDDIDFFRFPIIDKTVPVGEDAPTDGYFMAAKSQHVKAGKRLIAFFGSVEAQKYTADQLGRLATNGDVDLSIYGAVQQKGIKMIQGADFVAQFYDRDTTPEMADKGMNGFMEFWDNPQRIDDILGRLEAARKEIFQQ
jgi:ABC-type glycerol-3-phosphate transport system substrate-binding protein